MCISRGASAHSVYTYVRCYEYTPAGVGCILAETPVVLCACLLVGLPKLVWASALHTSLFLSLLGRLLIYTDGEFPHLRTDDEKYPKFATVTAKDAIDI